MLSGKTLLNTGKFGYSALRRFSETEIKEIGIFTATMKIRSEK